MQSHSSLGRWAGALVLLSSTARADTVSGARSPELGEHAHTVRLRLEPGQADLVVRRTLWNGGPRHDQATVRIDVPQEAVAIGLRTLGSGDDGRIAWFEAELMEAEAAAKKYERLTGIGGFYPKDPALLSWRALGLLTLQVFPVAPRTEKTLEYTLAMPTHYSGGRYHVALAAMGTLELPATLSVMPGTKADRLFVDDAPMAEGASIRLDQPHDVATPWRGPGPFAGGLASIPIGGGRALTHFHVEAASPVSRVPEDAYVVVVIDASRSVGEQNAKASLAAADATLAHFPGAHVEVVTFDRVPHERYGAFVSVEAARADLAKATLRLRNGSNLDDALARADALLESAPAGAARRILAMSDLEMRAELTPARVKPMLKSGAVLHIGLLDEYAEASLSRDDTSVWAPVARATGGLVWNAHATEEIGGPGMAKVYEEWARPLRLDHPRIVAPGLEGPLTLPETLDEGEGIEDLRVNGAPVSQVTLEGELWSTPSRTRLAPDAEEAKRWSALVFGAIDKVKLTDPEMMVLARRGHAVSPVTSLLAVEPGVRPSTEGFGKEGWGDGGGGHGEGIGLGSIGTIGHGMSTFEPERYLRDAVRSGLTACGAPSGKATVKLETSFVEILDVASIRIDGIVGGSLTGWCLREALWALELPPGFHARRASWTIDTRKVEEASVSKP